MGKTGKFCLIFPTDFDFSFILWHYPELKIERKKNWYEFKIIE